MRKASVVLALVLVACTHGAAVADRLYCGLSMPDGGVVSEGQLEAVVRDEVVSRFPEGFTLWRARGVYRGGHEESMVIEILHPHDARTDRAIEDIAAAYRTRFHQTSVLRVRVPARMEFIE
jgi:hypothetical protein